MSKINITVHDTGQPVEVQHKQSNCIVKGKQNNLVNHWPTQKITSPTSGRATTHPTPLLAAWSLVHQRVELWRNNRAFPPHARSRAVCRSGSSSTCSHQWLNAPTTSSMFYGLSSDVHGARKAAERESALVHVHREVSRRSGSNSLQTPKKCSDSY